MAVDPIGGIDKTSAGYDAARQYQVTPSEQKAEQLPVTREEDQVMVSLQRSSGTMGRLGSVNEQNFRFATQIRETNKALQDVSALVDGMNDRLGTIVKNWPPFPQDSEERKDLLMSYTALRKEIINLMVPPPPQLVYERNQGLWSKLVPGGESFENSVPDLATTATDSEIGTALAKIKSFHDAVNSGKQELIKAVSE